MVFKYIKLHKQHPLGGPRWLFVCLFDLPPREPPPENALERSLQEHEALESIYGMDFEVSQHFFFF